MTLLAPTQILPVACRPVSSYILDIFSCVFVPWAPQKRYTPHCLLSRDHYLSMWEVLAPQSCSVPAHRLPSPSLSLNFSAFLLLLSILNTSALLRVSSALSGLSLCLCPHQSSPTHASLYHQISFSFFFCSIFHLFLLCHFLFQVYFALHFLVFVGGRLDWLETFSPLYIFWFQKTLFVISVLNFLKLTGYDLAW